MQATLFDMDGVLVDSERYWKAREREEIFPATVDAAVDPEDVSGMNIDDLYEHLAARHPMKADHETFVAHYDDAAEVVYTEEAELLAGVRSLLEDLRGRGVQVALVSSSPVRFVEMVLDHHSLHDAFDAVVSADHVDHGKPEPDVYLRAADLLDVPPGECVAVEDSAHGVSAARAAGMRVVGYFGQDDDATALPGVDATATDGAELAGLLGEWLSS